MTAGNTVFMNKDFLEILINWKEAYISGVDLHYILDKSPDSRHGAIKRAVHNGHLTPIRRDLYLINRLRKERVDPFEIAPIIYGPSYVSFESALSYHGWIPEAVRTITCASVKRSKEYQTPIGAFSYQHIPIEAFSFGVGQIEQNGSILFIGNPVKALADIIYARKRSWKDLNDLYDDLRIEPETFQDSDKQLLIDLIKNYPSPRVQKALHLLLKGLHI